MKTHNRLFYFLLSFLAFCMILLVILFNYLTSPQGHSFLAAHCEFFANANQSILASTADKGAKSASGKDPNAYYNLNAVTYEQLCTIEGIGPTKATAILQKRDELGGYSDVEQLLDIEGIGESIYEEISPHLYV